MKKLIDADELKVSIEQLRTTGWGGFAPQSYDCALIQCLKHIDAMPDAGCARNQRTTQYCAEVEAVRAELDALRVEVARTNTGMNPLT